MMLTRRTFLSRTASAIFGVMAAVYAPWSGSDITQQRLVSEVRCNSCGGPWRGGIVYEWITLGQEFGDRRNCRHECMKCFRKSIND